MKSMMKKSQVKKLVVTLLLGLLLLPAAAWSMGPGSGACNQERFAQRMDRLQETLSLNESQQLLWSNMTTAIKDMRDLVLQEGDQLESQARRRWLGRNHLLMRAELAATQPNFTAVGEQLKKEYVGDYSEKFNALVDARVAFFSSLSQEQRDLMLQSGFGKKQRRGRGQRPGWNNNM